MVKYIPENLITNGIKIGKHKFLKNKSIEGSVAFLIASFFSSLIFISPILALIGSLAATLAELIPEFRIFEKMRNMDLIDDNLTIPLFSGFIILLASVFF